MGNIAFVIYVLGRMLPYAITSGMIVTTQYIGNQRNNEYTVWKIQKALLFCISFVANCLLFIGVHYWFYKDIYIVNRVLAIRNLNFYYQEIEYFLISMSLSIVLAIVMGLLIQILLNGGVLTVRARDKKVLLMIMFTFGALIVIGFAFKMENFTDSRIIISEVCACNKSVSLDEKGTVEDYVELYNQGTLPFYLDSYYLSDSTRNLKAKSLKGLVIMPREYLVVPCVDGVNSFGIGNEGETIYLSNEKGYIIQEVSFEKMEEDRAYVKEDILSDEWSFAECSPGKENLKREKVPSPVF